MSVRQNLACALLLSGLALGSASGISLVGSALAQASTATLRGTVTIKGPVTLPANAQASVTLEDVSLADAPSVILSKTVFSPVGGARLGYALGYDASLLKPGHRYALRAEIRNGATLLYISTEALMNTGAVPEQTALVVEPVSSPLPAALVGSWKIDRIGTQITDPAAPAFLVFRADGFLSGTGGCNRLMGHVTADATTLGFGPMAGTRMACFGNRMTQEEAVFDATRKVTTWRMEKGLLLLSDARGVTVLSLSPNAADQAHKAQTPQTSRNRKSR